MAETIVALLLDRSGSMKYNENLTVMAVNEFIARLQSEPSIRFSLITYDSVSTEVLVKNQLIESVQPITRDAYKPGLLTPLVDATYKLIKAVEQYAEGYSDPPKIVICIQTDGTDNASTEYDFFDLNKLISEKRDAGWQFNLMAVGVHRSHLLGVCMGIPFDWAMGYGSNTYETSMAFAVQAANIIQYASGKRNVTCFTYSQRQEAGDHDGLKTPFEREGAFGIDERGAPDLGLDHPDPHPQPPKNAPPVVPNFRL